MHSGTPWPYDLSARVFMGNRSYPNWIRKSYTLGTTMNPIPWVGSLAAQMTVQQVVAARDSSFEASPESLVLCGFAQMTTAGAVYVGLQCWLSPNRQQLLTADQVWVAGQKQFDETAMTYFISSFGGWQRATIPPVFRPGAVLGTAPTQFNANGY